MKRCIIFPLLALLSLSAASAQTSYTVHTGTLKVTLSSEGAITSIGKADSSWT